VADPQQRPLSALPSPLARGLAFAAIVAGGFLGGLVGWLFVAVQSDNRVWAAVSAAVCAIGFALGTSVVAVLVLRAMGEWRPMSEGATEPAPH
jgi:hypothetical protein